MSLALAVVAVPCADVQRQVHDDSDDDEGYYCLSLLDRGPVLSADCGCVGCVDAVAADMLVPRRGVDRLQVKPAR